MIVLVVTCRYITMPRSGSLHLMIQKESLRKAAGTGIFSVEELKPKYCGRILCGCDGKCIQAKQIEMEFVQ